MTDRDNITLPRKHIDYAAHALEHFNKDAPDQLVSEIIHHLRTALAAEPTKPSEDVEALRRDAERFRWLRDNAAGFSGRTLDAAIDAAMEEKR